MVTRDSGFLVATADEAAVTQALPATGRELAEAIGLLPTLELMRSFGGSRLFVPSGIADAQSLCDVLGRDAAAALVARYGGNSLEPATLQAVERLLRDNAIRADFDAGASLHELVRRYRLTGRAIRTILKASAATAPRRFAGVGRDE